ncbi:hypothetical protein V6N11_012310 [Hibiscus sabdariffa]|uniref:Uncharacterized protein n=1 Tax=Hibiscus sabdariffa TaxID=183260 RepID=A0ABR2QB33_9ROSI
MRDQSTLDSVDKFDVVQDDDVASQERYLVDGKLGETTCCGKSGETSCCGGSTKGIGVEMTSSGIVGNETSCCCDIVGNEVIGFRDIIGNKTSGCRGT